MSLPSFKLRKYPTDIIKSSVHKYLRRKNKDMFIRCMLEFYLICKDNKNFDPLIIRIQIICAEEILFNNYNSIISIYQKLKEFRNNFDNYSLIIDCCYLLINSRRTRLVKYILGYYSLGIDYGFCQLNSKTEKKEYKLLTAPFKKEKDSELLVDNVNMFYTLFKNFDYRCFYYALKTFYKFKNSSIRFKTKKKAMYWIWEILLDETKNNKQLNEYIKIMLEYFHYPCNYKSIFLIQSILLYLHQKDEEKDILNEEKIDYKKIIERHKRIKFTIDPFCIDVHTKIGRSYGKTKFDFYNDGIIIVDENLKYVDKHHFDVYIKALKQYHSNKIISKQLKI
jgi:hypothetical protein